MIKNIGFIVSRGLETIVRFPLPVILSLLFFAIAIQDAGHARIEHSSEMLAILFCGFFATISVTLFVESQRLHRGLIYLISVAAILLMGVLFYNDDAFFHSFSFLGTGLFLSIFIAPFINRKAFSMEVWVFSYHLFIHICITVLIAIILFLGLEAIILSMHLLFGLQFKENVYFDVWLIVATVFSPLVAMSGIPDRFNEVRESYPKALRLVLSYIVIPLLLVYAVILYGYTAKILIIWELPKGGVTYLVTAFGSIGIVAYLASYPLHHSAGIIRFFSRKFFTILLVPLALFAIAISVRIVQYGITEDRYATFIALVWFAISSFLVLTKHRNQAAKTIFLSIVILMIVGSFGPWGAVSMSTWSQVSRLEMLLKRNKVLVYDGIHKISAPIDKDDRASISSIVDYLVSTRKLDAIKPWFADVPHAHINESKSSMNATLIMQDMGIEYLAPYRRQDADISYFNVNNNWLGEPYIDIAGYDYLVNVGDVSFGTTGFAKDIKLGASGMTLNIAFDQKNNQYKVRQGAEEIVFNLEEMLKRDALDQANNHAVAHQVPIAEKKSQHYVIRLLINRVYGSFKNDSQKPDVSSLGTTLLIKKQ